MNSKRKQELAESLDSALEPPRRRAQGGRLSELLADYTDPRDFPPRPGQSEIELHEPESLLVPVRLTESASLTNPISLTDSTRPADSIRLTESVSLADAVSLAITNNEASSAARLTDAASLTTKDQAVTSQSLLDAARLSAASKPDFSLLNSLPDVSGYHFEFHQVTDYLLPQLAENEQAIYKQLYRLTWGFQRTRTIIGVPKLAARANVGESTTRRIIKALEKKGVIRIVRLVFGLNHEQGYEFEVFPPPALMKYLEAQGARRKSLPRTARLTDAARLTDTASMKEESVSSNKTHPQTGAGVSVASRFSLEECRQYANHLKATGQGITNPGGYATKIFRSGEADALVKAFLHPPAPIDISQCPDCNGMGMYYPNGVGNGPVAKCRHVKLTG